MARLFFNILPFSTMKICQIAYKFAKRLKILPNTIWILSKWPKLLNVVVKWRNFAKSRHTGQATEPLHNFLLLGFGLDFYFILLQQIPSRTYPTAWPDFANISSLANLYKYLATHFWGYNYFGKILNPLCQIIYAIWPIFFVENGQILNK